MRNIKNRPDLYCINTATLGFNNSIFEILTECNKRDIRWISPWIREISSVSIEDLMNELKKNNIKVSSLCRSSYYTAPTKEQRMQAIQENRSYLKIASKLHASCFMQVVGSLYQGQKDLEIVRDQVKEGISSLLEDSYNLGVPLAIEALHPMTAGDRSCITTLKEAIDLCEELDPTDKYQLGITVDVYHTWWDASIFSEIERAKNRILAFHVSDWKIDTTDLVNDRGMPGEGCINIPKIRSAVEKTGYLGPIEIEVFSKNKWWNKTLPEILDTCVNSISTYC